MPVTRENWGNIKEDAAALNLLTAALTHLIHLGDQVDDAAERVMDAVFTAYLLGRTADERAYTSVPESFRAFIDELDLSGLHVPRAR